MTFQNVDVKRDDNLAVFVQQGLQPSPWNIFILSSLLLLPRSEGGAPRGPGVEGSAGCARGGRSPGGVERGAGGGGTVDGGGAAAWGRTASPEYRDE